MNSALSARHFLASGLGNVNPNENGVARTHTRFPRDSVVVKGPLECSWASMNAPADRYVSLLRVKAAASNLLPHDSLARKVILAEDDNLPLGRGPGQIRDLRPPPCCGAGFQERLSPYLQARIPAGAI